MDDASDVLYKTVQTHLSDFQDCETFQTAFAKLLGTCNFNNAFVLENLARNLLSSGLFKSEDFSNIFVNGKVMNATNLITGASTSSAPPQIMYTTVSDNDYEVLIST